ncbi:MAG: hypothetical protein IRZ07_19270 [Microbispora sp.]|nr:hypothetical protein [Microbispora sp.]
MAIATLAVLAVNPVIGASADPTPVEGCNPDLDPQHCAVVTVTITVTPTGSEASPTSDPVVTKTITITPTPTHSPTPKQVTTSTAPPASTTEQDPPAQSTQQLPTQPISTPELPAANTSPTPEDEGQVVLPTASTEQTPDATQQTPGSGVTFEPPDPETVPIEIRNATPEYDKPELAHWLAIPAAVLVGVALLTWLIFEGRVRRMAHAAVVRRGGTAVARTPAPEAAAYPAAAPGYAPMVGFVPVQTYAVSYPQQPYAYPVSYGYPQPYAYPVADPAQLQAQQFQAQQFQAQAGGGTEAAPGPLPQQPPGE